MKFSIMGFLGFLRFNLFDICGKVFNYISPNDDSKTKLALFLDGLDEIWLKSPEKENTLYRFCCHNPL